MLFPAIVRDIPALFASRVAAESIRLWIDYAVGPEHTETEFRGHVADLHAETT